jgi:hypothetical protein
VSDVSDVSGDGVEVHPVITGASPEDEEGGSPVCLAHLVCEECGAVTADGHRATCSLAGI